MPPKNKGGGPPRGPPSRQPGIASFFKPEAEKKEERTEAHKGQSTGIEQPRERSRSPLENKEITIEKELYSFYNIKDKKKGNGLARSDLKSNFSDKINELINNQLKIIDQSKFNYIVKNDSIQQCKDSIHGCGENSLIGYKTNLKFRNDSDYYLCNCCFICGLPLFPTNDGITKDTSDILYPNCEHILPYFSGAAFIGLYISGQSLNDTSKKNYGWCHNYCNQGKGTPVSKQYLKDDNSNIVDIWKYITRPTVASRRWGFNETGLRTFSEDLNKFLTPKIEPKIETIIKTISEDELRRLQTDQDEIRHIINYCNKGSDNLVNKIQEVIGILNTPKYDHLQITYNEEFESIGLKYGKVEENVLNDYLIGLVQLTIYRYINPRTYELIDGLYTDPDLINCVQYATQGANFAEFGKKRRSRFGLRGVTKQQADRSFAKLIEIPEIFKTIARRYGQPDKGGIIADYVMRQVNKMFYNKTKINLPRNLRPLKQSNNLQSMIANNQPDYRNFLVLNKRRPLPLPRPLPIQRPRLPIQRPRLPNSSARVTFIRPLYLTQFGKLKMVNLKLLKMDLKKLKKLKN
jgi:hypothetical protein